MIDSLLESQPALKSQARMDPGEVGITWKSYQEVVEITVTAEEEHDGNTGIQSTHSKGTSFSQLEDDDFCGELDHCEQENSPAS